MAEGERHKSQHGLSAFARRLLGEWGRLALPSAGERVVVAVSGGADSCALLLAFDELIKARRLALSLCVAHLDHELRGEAGESDARWVAELAFGLGYESRLGRAAVAERASEARDNLEQAARRERYEFLGRVAREEGAVAVLVGHTLDDQAETVLLALLRGSGANGLGGMSPVRTLEAGSGVLLVRPLLDWARWAETVAYCRERGVEPRIDAMNEDENYKRVRVRRQLLPLLKTFNPRAVEAVSRAAELLREDADALEEQAAELLLQASRSEELRIGTSGLRIEETKAKARIEDANFDQSAIRNPQSAIRCVTLDIEVLRAAQRAVRRRALRQWIEGERGSLRRLELVHVRAIELLLEGERGGRVAELPGGSCVERRGRRLWFIADCGLRTAD